METGLVNRRKPLRDNRGWESVDGNNFHPRRSDDLYANTNVTTGVLYPVVDETASNSVICDDENDEDPEVYERSRDCLGDVHEEDYETSAPKMSDSSRFREQDASVGSRSSSSSHSLYPDLYGNFGATDRNDPVMNNNRYGTSYGSSSVVTGSHISDNKFPPSIICGNVSPNPDNPKLMHAFSDRPMHVYVSEEKYDWGNLFLLLLFVIGCVVGSVYFMGWLNSSGINTQSVLHEKRWISAMKALYHNHSSQPQKTYSLITSAGRRLIKWGNGGDGMDKNDMSPAMFKPACVAVMFDASKETGSSATNCFISKVGQLYNAVKSNSGGIERTVKRLHHINALEFEKGTSGDTGDIVKLKLDLEVRRVLKDPQSGGVLLISEIDKLSPDAALILHTHCDENPPVKNTLIFLTIGMPEDFALASLKPEVWTQVMESRLQGVWGGGIIADRLGAIFARIGDYVTVVLPDESLSCD